MSFPTTASFVPSRDSSPTPAFILSFPLHSSLFSPSFFIRCPDKTFLPVIYRVTNGVPRGLYSRVAVTPLASSPWPAHAIYLSRLRDSSLSLILTHPHTHAYIHTYTNSHKLLSSRRLPCRCSQRAVASFVRRSPSSISFRGRRLFRAYFCYEPANLPRKRLESIYESIHGRSSRRRILVESRIILSSSQFRDPLHPLCVAARFVGYSFDEMTCFTNSRC